MPPELTFEDSFFVDVPEIYEPGPENTVNPDVPTTHVDNSGSEPVPSDDGRDKVEEDPPPAGTTDQVTTPLATPNRPRRVINKPIRFQ